MTVEKKEKKSKERNEMRKSIFSLTVLVFKCQYIYINVDCETSLNEAEAVSCNLCMVIIYLTHIKN